MSPQIEILGSWIILENSDSISSSENPCLDSSWETFTCSSTEVVHCISPLTDEIFSKNLSESIECMRWNRPTALRTLLGWSVPNCSYAKEFHI